MTQKVPALVEFTDNKTINTSVQNQIKSVVSGRKTMGDKGREGGWGGKVSSSCSCAGEASEEKTLSRGLRERSGTDRWEGRNHRYQVPRF